MLFLIIMLQCVLDSRYQEWVLHQFLLIKVVTPLLRVEAGAKLCNAENPKLTTPFLPAISSSAIAVECYVCKNQFCAVIVKPRQLKYSTYTLQFILFSLFVGVVLQRRTSAPWQWSQRRMVNTRPMTIGLTKPTKTLASNVFLRTTRMHHIYLQFTM